jgi:hypothetical protein
VTALERMRESDPSAYFRVIAGILPDKLEVDIRQAVTRIERVIVDHRPRVIEHDASPGASQWAGVADRA